MSKTALTISNIEKSYISKTNQGLKKTQVLTKKSFKIDFGEIFLLTGSNGSGKTTLLKVINGILNADLGEISFSKQIKRHEISYLSSNENCFFPRLTVEENFQFFLGLRNINISKTHKLFSALNLPYDLMKKRFFNLSIGEKKKVSIIKALANDPKFILMDEPTIGLDKDSKDILIKLILHLQKKGSALIIATHDKALFTNIYQKEIRL